MIDEAKLKELLSGYRRDFLTEEWPEEKYKWEAIDCFQKNWDVQAEDFAEMLERSLAKTGNLLGSTHEYPRAMMLEFAAADPEEVRGMFLELYDESRDLCERVQSFKDRSEVLLRRLKEPNDRHYQDEHAITVYLWLRYPDKYYIYKYSLVKQTAQWLDSDHRVKKGAYAENLRNAMQMYDEICAQVQQDQELTALFRAQLTDTCYPDPELRTLSHDISRYIYRLSAGKIGKKDDPDQPDQKKDSDETASLPDTPVGVSENESGDQQSASDETGDLEKVVPPYTKEDFLREVYLPEAQFDRMRAVLARKKNLILQGAPGVGKTFAARRLAWAMMGEKDEERIAFVQFHQNYSYEDFVMGYRPDGEGFKLQSGIFHRFCQKAESQPEKDFFLIIDEINRGNISKIFGELLMLIEKDYRGVPATLAYSGEPFAVPENLYIIGMMNTADRSLAMIDYALRRRFSFLTMEPGFDSEGFTACQKSLDDETFDALIDAIKALNRRIEQDPSLGKGFCIGHSYFCGQEAVSEDWMRDIVDFDILPMLEEYWFDDPDELRRWENVLHGVFQS